jgi:hypothetical protein
MFSTGKVANDSLDLELKTVRNVFSVSQCSTHGSGSLIGVH